MTRIHCHSLYPEGKREFYLMISLNTKIMYTRKSKKPLMEIKFINIEHKTIISILLIDPVY